MFDQTLPHVFEPRKHGAKGVCRWCGAPWDDPIHTNRRKRRILPGQALVEFALVTPILLLMILGLVGVGLLVTDRTLLIHAAQEAAVAGAMDEAQACVVAEATAEEIYPGILTTADCAVRGTYIEVTVGHDIAWPIQFDVTVTATAVRR